MFAHNQMKLLEFDENLIGAISDCKGAVKNCAVNAITHLTKAWEIKDIDQEMSIFRGITAEEEAAASLFYSLRNNRYNNAEKIKFTQHTDKLGLYPFMSVVYDSLLGLISRTDSPFDAYSLIYRKVSNRAALELSLKLRGTTQAISPLPPLNYSVSDGNGVARNFKEQFKAAVEGAGYTKAKDYVKNIAGLRNRLLYASSAGAPDIKENAEKFILNQQEKVLGILYVVLLSDPWVADYGRSSFVQQALDSYLLLLEKIEPAS